MGLWIGNKIPRQLAIGSTEAKAVYKGAVKQWERKEEEFLRRVSPATADVVLGTIKGKSLVWNQLVDTSTTSVDTISGRKYYTLIGGTASIVTGDGTPMSVTGGVDMVTDLTLLFGAGNEPSTVEEFEAMFPADYYNYDAGSLLNLTAESVVSNGQTLNLGLTDLPVISPNIWDEEWEEGSYDSSGNPVDSSTTMRSKNPIPVLPDTTYYVGANLPSNGLFCFDAQLQFIGSAPRSSSYLCTTLPGTAFAKFRAVVNYGIVYKNDICINISDASINGTYWPHNPFKDGMKRAGSVYDETTEKVATRRLGVVDLGTLSWAKNVTYGNFQTSISDGAFKGEAVLPRYAKSSALVTSLADGAYTTNAGSSVMLLCIKDTTYADSASFKAAMAGVLLIYELATPQEFPFSTPQDWTYEEQQGGTVQVTPVNDGTTPATAPMDAIRTYNY